MGLSMSHSFSVQGIPNYRSALCYYQREVYGVLLSPSSLLGPTIPHVLDPYITALGSQASSSPRSLGWASSIPVGKVGGVSANCVI